MRAGARPDLAATTAVGPLDELVALHDELGVSAALEAAETARQRAGVADRLLVRTLAVRPFVGNVGLRGVAEQRFREPAILLQRGWSPVQVRQGDNGRHRHAEGRRGASLPCHPDTLRDALARIGAAAWLRAQRAAVTGRYQRGLVRGGVDAVDGTGLGADRRVVALICVAGAHPVVAWRSLAGSASAKGKAAAVTRALHPGGPRQALAAGGAGCSTRLLADGRYADGRLLAWLKDATGIAALVRLPAARLRYEELQGLAAGRRLPWHERRDTRTIQGRKERRTVALAGVGPLDSGPRFVAAATAYGAPGAHLWACPIRARAPTDQPLAEAEALGSTRDWPQPWAAFQAYRGRWTIEDDPFREMKEGWGLERQPWGLRHEAIRGRVTLTLLACNTAQRYRTPGGQRLADKGIRRLRQLHRRERGAAPVVVSLDGRSGVFAVEEVFALLGAPVRASLLPQSGTNST